MIKGTLYHAKAHPDLQKTRPTFAFVPDYTMENGIFNLSIYSGKRWQTINAGANENAIGSHIFPDLEKPISLKEESSEISQFLKKLDIYAHKHRGPTTGPRRPGRDPELEA